MFCNMCGANLPDDSLFCLSCGTRLEFQNEKQEILKEAVPMQAAPMQFTPMQMAPMQTAPMQTAPMQFTPMQVAPMQVAPMQVAPIQEAPVVSPEPDDIPTTILNEEELDRIADVIKNDSDAVTEEAATAEKAAPAEETAPVEEAEPVHNISAKSELEKIEILKKYKELLDMDAITIEEYNLKKAALLA